VSHAASRQQGLCPPQRHAAPEEIARSAPYLASDLLSFVTGTMLMADGGLRG
jgi:NAD(P)-dependent dehydrogenase (short-subunit alcohol dehydrogenase family)